MRRPTLLLGDDHHIVLEGIRKLLEPEYEVVGTAVDGRALVESAIHLQPDIVVLDIGMPLLNGLEAARQIRQAMPSVRIVVLTQQLDNAYLREAFRVGASAYVVKQSAGTELLAALKACLRGEYYVSSTLANRNEASRFNREINPSELFGRGLTPRQREVLQLIAEGQGAKEIAATLGISVKTVEFHKAAIMEEVGLKTTAELTRYAIEHGIVA